MARLIPMKCPKCNAPLEVPDDIPRFFCQYCGTPIVLAETPGFRLRETPQAEATSMPQGPKPLVPIPEKLQISEYGDDLRISWRWFSWAVIFLIPFCIGWNAFLVGWYSMAMNMGGGGDFMPWAFRMMFLLFPMAHVAVGLGLIYAVAVMLVNRTTILVRYGDLSVKHGPIYFPGSRTIPVDEIEQLYCGREESSRGTQGGVNTSYKLMVLLKSGQTVPLLPGSTEYEVARAVEQLVEKHLGIEDAPVAGEA